MRTQRSFRSEAVVLRHSDWGEADRLLVLFTRERGKARALAKGARKMRSRKAGHLEPFTRVSLQLAVGRDLLIVTQAETVDAYLALRADLVRTGYAGYVVELIDRFTYEEEKTDASLYGLLIETLGRIASQPDAWLSIRYFEIRLLDALGFRPKLFQCANCGQEIQPEDQYFSADQGGVLCRKCGPDLSGAWEVSLEALKYLRHFQRSNFNQVRQANPGKPVKIEVEELIQRYFTYLLERELKSPGFLRQIKR